MSPEREQNAPEAPGTAGSKTAGPKTTGPDAAGLNVARADSPGLNGAEAKAPGSAAAPKPRAGVPVWRTGKPDAVLAAAVDVARAAVETIGAAEQIGRHLGARTEGDRLVTHLFESKLPGYGGWQWYAVLTRNSRSKVVTVNELGLLPSEDSILAPEWVPWAERVRPEDAQPEEAQVAGSAEPAPAATGQAAGDPDADAAIQPDAAQDVDEPDAADMHPAETDAADADADADSAAADNQDDADGSVQPVPPAEEAD